MTRSLEVSERAPHSAVVRIVAGCPLFSLLATAMVMGLLLVPVNVFGYGNQTTELHADIAKKLAEAYVPNDSGAIGRNKRAYFHVRFQRGMHHVADYGLASKRHDVLERFLTAVEYSLENQLPSGDFRLVIPESLKDQGKPSVADRTSGVAFFTSSLGLGIHALETNDWFMTCAECADLRQRLSAVKPRLQATLDFLLKNQEYLKDADKHAPNRLLFDALAFETLGKILNNNAALEVAASFVAGAVNQVHAQKGYFVEGGGFDSSYNAVATALAFRLLMINAQHGHDLKKICSNAIRWQKTRILDSGEVTTQGNARVRPGNSGESFLGKEKGVDIGHVVEAFMLASQALSDPTYNYLAQKVIDFYENKRDK